MTLTFFLHLLKDVFLNALSITALVMVMLLLVEFVNVSSSGKLMGKLRHRPVLQIILAAFMGLIPGCLGGFAVVSLFTHKMISFGALVAGMISSFGDEAFVMFAFSPSWTLVLALILVMTGIITGITIYLIVGNKTDKEKGHTFEIHHDHAHAHEEVGAKLSVKNLKNISFPRAILLFGLIVYLFLLLSGTLSHEHSLMPEVATHSHEHAGTEQCHDPHHHHEVHTDCSHGEVNEHRHSHGVFSWENILFMTLALITLVIVGFSSEHFLESHLWKHIIKEHFISIFLWTFGVLLFLSILFYFVDLKTIIEQNQWALLFILFIAILIGIIPESGPHLIFVVMFFSGAIPFSILLANSIVQDGHSALPLLAESRKNFLQMKLICMVVALIVGLAGYFTGF